MNTSVWFALVCALALACLMPCLAETQTFPPVTLRGYGTLSGVMTTSEVAGQPASVLKITGESVDKAKLVQAKYLSDLQTFPGVKPMTLPGNIATYAVTEQGAMLAAREGKVVYVLTAGSTSALTMLQEQTLSHLRPVYTPEVSVPMYLDRWDKYSFRFYYGPLTVPKDANGRDIKSYDPSADFAFANELPKGGLTIWQVPHAAETAEGIMNTTVWDWALHQSAALGLPVGINTQFDTKASWIFNRYPEQMTQHHPQFLGGWYGVMNFSEEIVSWSSEEAHEVGLGQMQRSVRKLAQYDNITSWLEPHAEMGHGSADKLVDYGPVADRGYREFLRERYRTVSAVSRRWYGNAKTLTRWDDVRVPELASFLGWGPQAIDLTGTWRISYDAPFAASSADPQLDDTAWPTIQAPGHRVAMLLPRQPAVYRRRFTVDPAWLAAHRQAWIYVLDLNDTRPRANEPRTEVQVYLNGQRVPEPNPRRMGQHWSVLEVTGQLRAGENALTITLPQGMFCYRAYLSPQPLRMYPNLGAGMNAQWVDYFDWNGWSREHAVLRGTQMIRQVDPDRGIMFMSPDAYMDNLWKVARAYGGEFHNTGYMAGFWADLLPSLMRGARMPFSTEPGGPARTAAEFKKHFGYWLTEGVNAVDYFMHLGDILWYPEVKKTFEENRQIYTSMGKYHVPTAEVAALYSMRSARMNEFPLEGLGYGEVNPGHLGSSYWRWNVRSVLRGVYDSDGLTDSAFATGDAARYKVILDTNTTIMDEAMVRDIEQYVRDGGTFVTFVQTGRHTSVEPDTWPIARLTGYQVTNLEQQTPWQTGLLRPAPIQDVFAGTWMRTAHAGGFSMRRVAPDAQNLLYWQDGSVAAGMRKLGKGAIIQIGCRFTAWGLPDRIDHEFASYIRDVVGRAAEYGIAADPNAPLLTPELAATRELFASILRWRGIAPVPMHLEPFNETVITRHFISNNGLYDVWAIWNQHPTQSAEGALVLDTANPGWRISLRDNAVTPVTGRRVTFNLAPYAMDVYLTPREALVDAPQQWFTLQCDWWKGTGDPGKPIPQVAMTHTVDLADDWAFTPLELNQQNITALVAPQVNDANWRKMRLGVFSLPDFKQVRHALFRKRFTVPAGWRHGRVSLWMQSWNGETFRDAGAVYLDGALLRPAAAHGIAGDDCGGVLTPGSTHVLAVEVTGQRVPLGLVGGVWLAYHPTPAAQLDLAGAWEPAVDGLRYTAPVTLPGKLEAMTARRMAKIDAAHKGRTVVFHALADSNNLCGVIINGYYFKRFRHNIGNEMNLNITPWIKFGADNEIILVGGGKFTVRELSLEFHTKGTYP